MDFLKIAPYLFSGSVCFCLAIILITVRLFPLFQDKVYQRIKRFLAYCALIDVIVDVFIISFILHDRNIFSLDSFVIPVAYYSQLYLMSRAILGLLHSSDSMRVCFKFEILPVTIVIVFYVGGYLYNVGFYSLFSERSYVAYTTTLWAKSLSGILYFLVFVEFALLLREMISKTRLYLDKLKNYYSGTEVINGQRLSTIAWCFWGYFILAGCDFLLSSELLDSIFMIVNTCIFIFFVVFIINLQGVYLSVQHVEDFSQEKSTNCKKREVLLESEKEMEYSYFLEKTDEIISAINKWECSTDKPFLKEGIVLADVAESLGMTDAQLSLLLNHSMKLNFNAWINKLRIEESIRIIGKNPQMTVAEIAYACGFLDPNTFTRNFKKVIGVTPTTYKKLGNQ